MAIALISDIHGNLHALEAVLEDIQRCSCREIVCLGDLVGYGGDPEACVARVRTIAEVTLLGNHDAVAAGLLSDDTFNDAARGAIRGTRALLSDDSLAYLAALPTETVIGDVQLAHAHPVDASSWAYIFPGERLEEVFEGTVARLMAVGHTHTPGVGTLSQPVLALLRAGELMLRRDERYLFNVGSVGQPRDRDPRAAWARLDVEGDTFELRRVDYDVAGAQQSIRARGFPGFLADRLASGV